MRALHFGKRSVWYQCSVPSQNWPVGDRVRVNGQDCVVTLHTHAANITEESPQHRIGYTLKHHTNRTRGSLRLTRRSEGVAALRALAALRAAPPCRGSAGPSAPRSLRSSFRSSLQMRHGQTPSCQHLPLLWHVPLLLTSCTAEARPGSDAGASACYSDSVDQGCTQMPVVGHELARSL